MLMIAKKNTPDTAQKNCISGSKKSLSGAVKTPPASGVISTVISDDHPIDPSLTLDELHQMIGTHLAIAESAADRHDHREVEDQALILLGAMDTYKRRLRGRLTAAKWKSWGDMAPKDPKAPQS